MDEIRINIKDILYRIVRSWRIVLICMFAFAFLLNAVTATKNKLSSNKPQKIEESNVSIDKIRENLSDEELYAADSTVVAYKTYIEYLNYVKESPIMTMDPTKIPTLTMNYYVDTHYVAEYPVIQYEDSVVPIIESYKGEIVSQEAYELLADGFASPMGVNYISELLSVANNGQYRMLQIKMLAPSLEDCENLSGIIDDVIHEKTADIKKIYGDFDIYLVACTYTECSNANVIEAKRVAVVNLVNYKNYYVNMENALTDAQRTYFDACIQKLEFDIGTDGNGIGNNIEKVENSQMVSDTHSKYIYSRSIILGALFGLLFACCFIALAYVLASALRNKDDIESGYKIAILGTITFLDSNKRWLHRIDQLIYKIFYGGGPKFTENERINMICAGIRISVEKEQFKNVYITGTSNDDESIRIQQLIIEELKNRVDVSNGISVVYDPESLEKMTASSAVVFVERVGKSLYKDINKQKKLAERYKIPILGAVVIE